MKIALINPNSSGFMTEAIVAAARNVAPVDVQLLGLTNHAGPSSIEGLIDGVHAAPGLLDLIARHDDDVDAYVIACFDDTGLDAARSLTSRPVVGIGEAGYHAASFVAARFSVVTTLACSISILQGNLTRYGLAGKCGSVLAAGIPVLDLDNAEIDSLGMIGLRIKQAIEMDGAEAIVLGCAGMASFSNQLSQQFGLPVIDGVASAVGMASSLVRMGVSNFRAARVPTPLCAQLGADRP